MGEIMRHRRTGQTDVQGWREAIAEESAASTARSEVLVEAFLRAHRAHRASRGGDGGLGSHDSEIWDKMRDAAVNDIFPDEVSWEEALGWSNVKVNKEENGYMWVEEGAPERGRH